MIECEIAEIGIDSGDRLFVRPKGQSFSSIYRAAMEVGWDATEQYLHSPKPRAWSYAKWFGHISAAAASEYGVTLKIVPGTIWTNVPDQLRSEITAVQTRS